MAKRSPSAEVPLSSGRPGTNPVTVEDHRFRAMNTAVQVLVVGGDDRAGHRAEREVREREARWSRFLAGSELSLLNRAGGKPVIVSPDTYALVSQAIDAYHLTGGAFDPTVLACLQAAGYDRSFELLATGPEPSGRVAAPGPAGIELHPVTGAVVVPAGVGLDLGGIAKGAAADAVVTELMNSGVEGCCVNIGGDLRVTGRAPDSGPWVVELDCPGADERHRRQLALTEGAVCTSTVLRRCWAGPAGGPTTEHHLRHPATGEPLRTGLWSVSVVAATATQAEVLTKAAFVAGSHGAPELLAHFEVTGVLVLDGGQVVALEGLDRFTVDR
jgi:FAD:protein FMN transferase